MNYPIKCIIAKGAPNNITAPLNYNEICNGSWYLTLDTVILANVKQYAELLVEISTDLCKNGVNVGGVNDTVKNQTLQICMLKSTNKKHSYLRFNKTIFHKINNPAPIIKFEITDLQDKLLNKDIKCFIKCSIYSF